MSRRFSRVAALAATLAVGLTAASSASAVNWQSNGSAGGNAFSASTGFLVVKSALSNGFGYNCQAGALSGSVFGPTGPVSTSTWNSVLTFTPSFTTCSIAGIPVTISNATGGRFDATSYSGGTTTGRFRASWTATHVTCPFSVSIDTTATTNGTALTLPTTQSGTISWPAGNGVCDSYTGTTGGGSSNVRLVGYVSPNFTPLAFTYSGTAPSIFY